MLGVGFLAGGGAGLIGTAGLRAQLGNQEAQLASARRESQREINALAARLGELQAEANRLNALGERLTRIGQLQDGEFNFDKPVGVGGTGPVRDISSPELREGLDTLEPPVRLLRRTAVRAGSDAVQPPARHELGAVARADRQQLHHLRLRRPRRPDPSAAARSTRASISKPTSATRCWPWPMAWSAFPRRRSGYGNIVEIDHGNGYVTRYAHNSRLTLKVGALVRAGQEIAKAGSTGRSTGAHVHFEVWERGRDVNPRKFLSQQSPLKMKG